MTRKEKLFKGLFFTFMCVLTLAMTLHCFVCLSETYIHSYAEKYISYEYYGGDAYTGIQQAVADTGNNVRGLSSTVSTAGNEILGAILTTGAFVFMLIFFVCLYTAIRTFTSKIVEETKGVDTVNVSATVADISNDEIVEIERFNDLKNRGLISEEEFEAKKKRLLGI